MAITSESTQAEIIGQYLDNVSYDVDGDTTKVGLFIAACRALLVMHPANWNHSGESIGFNPEMWRQQLRDAQQWLASNGTTTSGVKHLSFGNFRP